MSIVYCRIHQNSIAITPSLFWFENLIQTDESLRLQNVRLLIQTLQQEKVIYHVKVCEDSKSSKIGLHASDCFLFCFTLNSSLPVISQQFPIISIVSKAFHMLHFIYMFSMYSFLGFRSTWSLPCEIDVKSGHVRGKYFGRYFLHYWINWFVKWRLHPFLFLR